MVKFAKDLDFSYAQQMKKDVASLFVDTNFVEINLKETQRASLACVQVLVAAFCKAERDGVKFIINASGPLVEILEQLGLDYILNKEGAS